MRKNRILIVACALLLSVVSYAQKIDRKELVQRHNIKNTKADPLSTLTVGNGGFAFTVDVTGLQSFPEEYQKGVSLGTQSDWAWHSFPNENGYNREDALKTFHLNGRDVTYMMQWNQNGIHKDASNWYRQNPHRLQLGNLGFVIKLANGNVAGLKDIQNIQQELNLWTGEIQSYFTVENIPVYVSTVCEASSDIIAVHVRSELMKTGRLAMELRLPYPTGEWTDEGTNYNNIEKHQSRIEIESNKSAIVHHQLDSVHYTVDFAWNGPAVMKEKTKHVFELQPADDHISFTAAFHPYQIPVTTLIFQTVKSNSAKGWMDFWNSGAAVDFQGSKDTRANELERRIILSQYLLRAQEANGYPPQETGLTYNSWFGKPHLEMTWWHASHYALWGRPQYLEKLMDWYASVADKGRAIAKRQGYEGIRWQKMTDNDGDETPSSVGAFLIWQQPHVIWFAELCYRADDQQKILERYKDIVFGTADFMASFARLDPVTNKYVLGKGLIPAQERFKAEETYNPTYELAYWHWALTTANEWRQRLGMKPNAKWNDVLAKLSPLPVQDGKYLFAESASDSYTNPEYKTDHPAVFGAYGMVNDHAMVDKNIMQNTFNWVWNNWSWKDTWGWDFPMTAMTATKLGQPSKAIDALLMNIQTNTYLNNGHNYQDDRLRIYLPGNGGILAAIALMVAGYDGSKENMPGIPKDGNWKVTWEGLYRFP